MKNLSESVRKNRPLLFLILFVLVAATWQIVSRQKINQAGVIIKASILKTETIKGGFLTTLSYRYADRIFKKVVRSKNGNQEAGDLYFIQVLPKKPDEVILFEDYPVPPCLALIDPPKEGWKKIPSCP
jgi:hypothetical protein